LSINAFVTINKTYRRGAEDAEATLRKNECIRNPSILCEISASSAVDRPLALRPLKKKSNITSTGISINAFIKK
jgi:hypothetical protein